MKNLLIVALFFCIQVIAGPEKQDYSGQYSQYQTEINRVKEDAKLHKLAKRTDETIAAIVMHASAALSDKGYSKESQQIIAQYKGAYEGYVGRNTQGDYMVGDFAPLVNWIDVWYKKIEGLLGKDFCRVTHISDLYAINHEVMVVFDPCNKKYTPIDFEQHFSGDGVYDGLFPIVVYWSTFVGCEIGTGGIGTIAWFCGAFGSAGEFLSENFVAPELGLVIYTSLCN